MKTHQTISNRRPRQLALAAATAAAMMLSTRTTHAQTWDGGGANTTWSTANNWNTNSVPASTANVVFGTGFGSGTSLYLDSNRTVNSLTINTTTGFSLDHYALTLTSGQLTRNDVAGTEEEQTIYSELIFPTNGTITVNGSNYFRIAQISQSGGTRNLTKTGTGTLFFTGSVPTANVLSGTFTIAQGTVRGLATTGPVVINSGATLVHAGSSSQNLTIAGAGSSSQPGALVLSSYFGTHSGTITLSSNATIAVSDYLSYLTSPLVASTPGLTLTKNGPGDLVLAANNSSFTGNYAVSDGWLKMGHANAFGPGTLTVTPGGCLDLNGFSLAKNISISGAGPGSRGALTNNNSFNNGTYTGTITLAGNATVGSKSGTLTIAGVINDGPSAFTLRKADTGDVILSSANSYDGGTVVDEGTLVVTHPNALGTGPVSANGYSDLALRGGVSIANPVTFSHQITNPAPDSNTFTGALTLTSNAYADVTAGGTLTLTGTLSDGAGSFFLTKNGAGRLVIAGANSLKSALQLQYGEVVLASSSALGPAGAYVTSNTALLLQGNINVPRTVTFNVNNSPATGSLRAISGNPTLSGDASFSTPMNNVGVDAGATLTLAGALSFTGSPTSASTATINKVGAGRLVLSGVNNLPTVSVAAGSLAFATAAASPPSLAISNAPSASVELLNNVTASPNLTLSGYGMPGSVGALRSPSGNNTFAGALTLGSDTSVGVDAGSTLTLASNPTDNGLNYSLTKVGPGTLILANTAGNFSGGFNIAGGTVQVGFDNPLGNGPVTLSNSAKLQFVGTAVTSRTFNANNGTIQVNAGAPLTFYNSTVTGGFLRGPGVITLSTGNSFAGTSIISATPLTHVGPTTFSNVTSAGNITSSSSLTWDAGTLTTAGSLTMNLGSTVTVNNFTNEGVITINTGATLDNVQTPFYAGGGSRITVNPAGTIHLLNNQPMELNGAFLRNDGYISGAPIKVNYGSLVTGTGLFPAVIVGVGGTFQPGNTQAAFAPNVSAPEGTITQTPGTFAVSAPVTLLADTKANIPNATDSLTFTTPMNSAAVNLAKTGAGKFTLPVLTALSLTADNGALAIAPSHTPAATSRLGALTLYGAGALDLNDNNLILDCPDNASLASAMTQVRQYLFSGNLTSSAAAPDHLTALAYVPNTLLGLTSFDNQAIDASTLLVKYTYAGDANLDGKINADDFALLDRGFRTGGSTWTAGDFNYDGIVTPADYLILDRTFATLNNSLSPDFLAQRQAQFGPDYVAALITAVPEPTTLATTLALSSLSLTRRRRRR